ncbi:MAG: hypothetical protein ACJ74H_01350 [Thermoanaerobaculia bacterium]
MSRWLSALVACAATVAFSQSYLRWLNPIIDAGRDLYIPEQLRLGATLYRDILYFYPPLTPYLLAAITAVTGSSLVAYIAIGAATALLTAIALVAIARPLAGREAAAAVLLVFVSFSVAGVSGWGSNYFFPYAHAATFAMLFFLGGVALLLHGRPALALALLLACSWTKLEYVVFASAVVVFAAMTRRISWKAFALYWIAAAASLVAATAYFGAATLRANIFPASLLNGSAARTFYAHVNGMDQWQANLLLAARGAALIIAFVLLLRMKRNALTWIALAFATVLLANDTFFRAWALLQLALIPFAIRRPREPLALLLLLSLCATSRVFLNLTPAWYGFVFILPVLLLIAYVLFAWLPERGVYSHESALLWLPLIVVICASGLLTAHRTYAGGDPITTVRGTYYDRSPSHGELLAYLRRNHARELVVMPEGLALNYLSNVRTPLRYQTFTPVEIAGNERPILAELAAKRPQYVAIVPRDVREFGSRGLGIDYGREIVGFLRANYEVEQRFGDIVLLRVRTRP